MFDLEVARQRVAKGVALLDKQRPGWRAEVDPAAISLYSMTDCILGQIYGGYQEGLAALKLDGTGRAHEYGFTCRSQMKCTCMELAQVWKDQFELVST